MTETLEKFLQERLKKNPELNNIVWTNFFKDSNYAMEQPSACIPFSEAIETKYVIELLEQARLDGIEQGRKLEKSLIGAGKLINLEINEQVVKEAIKTARQEGRREVLEEIERISEKAFDKYKDLNRNQYYLMLKKEDFEGLKKKNEKAKE